VGPMGAIVLRAALEQLGLCPSCFPWQTFDPKDGNAKYLVPTIGGV
jgi:hypothetical protein